MDAEERFDALAEARRQWEEHALGEPLSMHVATSVIHAQQVVSLVIERALRPLDLTFARYEVLMLLAFSRTGSLPTTKIGERLLVHPTGITKLVDKLEAHELVRREKNPEDRRGTLVRITAGGRHLASQSSEVLAAVRFGADLRDAELEQLIALLQRLRSAGQPHALEATAGVPRRQRAPGSL